jgi:hypothetical protein
MLHRVPRVIVLAFSVLPGACGEQYCQSSAKYGTQCYSINDIEWQERLVRSAPPPERATEPAPGCALVSGNGAYTVPAAGASASASEKPSAYLMSGACVTRRQPAH